MYRLRNLRGSAVSSMTTMTTARKRPSHDPHLAPSRGANVVPIRRRAAAGVRLSHVRALEAEAVHVLREVAAGFERPVLLFSGGKDSIVLLRLAEKAFRPGRFAFPLMHVDTGENFPETIEFRDRRVARARRAAAGRVRAGLDRPGPRQSRKPGRARRATGCRPRRCSTRSREHRFDCAIGGARRDEERARAKERIFSFRDDFGHWDPKAPRPELWDLYNTQIHPGEHVRAFPLSNWTELDVWEYIHQEAPRGPLDLLRHTRPTFTRDGMLYAYRHGQTLLPGETITHRPPCATAPSAT